MKHFDTFTGYGGFTISAQKLGWETVGFSEIDKYASAVLEYNFNIKNYGNISDIDFRQFRGESDIITGGTPCQDLSVAGKGKGLEGARSGLFFEFIRAVTESEVTYFVWENVKGALWSNKGWDFARVQIEMEQAGYDVWWQVINAKDFGVPQNRERIFAIGIRKGSGREVLFERQSSSKNPKTREQVSSTIHAGYYKQGGRDQQYINKIVNTGHVGSQHPRYTQDMRIRRLTPTECERLMGIEDGWTAKGIMDGEEVDISDTQRYKMCGNGVVVNCVDYIYKLVGEENE